MDGRILRAKFTLPDDPSQALEYEGYLEPISSPNDTAGPVRVHFVRGSAKRTDWGGSYSNLFDQSHHLRTATGSLCMASRKRLLYRAE
jgi:hypothetical protein